MIKNLIQDINLCGYTFEFIAKIMLRRAHKNNFIFMLCQFDSFDEILKKYRFDHKKIQKLVKYFKHHKCRCDIVEFKLNNTTERIILDVSFYEIKTKRQNTLRKKFDLCESNKKFLDKMTDSRYNCYIISVKLLKDWTFSIETLNYNPDDFRTYNSVITHSRKNKIPT
jgi:hypothetical protein